MFKNFVSQTNLPKINLIVGLCAFGFQLSILNPWHSQLSKQFNEIHLEIKDLKNNCICEEKKKVNTELESKSK